MTVLFSLGALDTGGNSHSVEDLVREAYQELKDKGYCYVLVR